MQTTATTQATIDSSSEPFGKAKGPKKWKSVAVQLTVYSSFADGNNYNGENQNPQPLVDRMIIVPLAERQYPTAQTKGPVFSAHSMVISQSFITTDGSYPLFRHLPGNRHQHQTTRFRRIVQPVVEYVRGALCL
jgi:hypothetical protein